MYVYMDVCTPGSINTGLDDSIIFGLLLLWVYGSDKNLDDIILSNIAFIMNIYMINSAKTSHVCTQGEIQLIATLNYYAYSLPPLASVNWSAFPQYFLLTM